jgi:hypothetical protein
MKAHTLRLAGTLLILAGTLGGCAAVEQQQAADAEKLLAAAGFEMHPADSAERQQDLANMPPLQVVARRQGGKTVYTYADPQNCRCLYVGEPKAYAEYRRLAVSEAIALDMNEVALNPTFMSWGAWGAWYPR